MNEINNNKDAQKIESVTHISFFHILSILFCFLFILSNISASKVSIISGVFIDAGTAFFPLLYIINDITTEVYGFKASRKVIWFAVVANILFTFSLAFIVNLSPSQNFASNTSFDILFNFTPRILVASVSSFLIGEYINSVILSVSKVKYSGKLFAFRAIFSTFVGVTIESSIFSVIAFYGVVPAEELVNMSIWLITIKVLYELISIPITIRFIKYLKLRENIDHYDYNTKFNILPF
jgi:uncharacterized integral membrane protein (TIGR00697 family)